MSWLHILFITLNTDNITQMPYEHVLVYETLCPIKILFTYK